MEGWNISMLWNTGLENPRDSSVAALGHGRKVSHISLDLWRHICANGVKHLMIPQMKVLADQK
jgi:hypothetical protein